MIAGMYIDENGMQSNNKIKEEYTEHV